MHVTAEAYRKLIAEDIAWLLQQPKCLERDHIALILNYQSIDADDELTDADISQKGTATCPK